MNKFKGFVKLTKEQYNELSANGSITIAGNTFTYDPNNTIYMVKEDESGSGGGASYPYLTDTGITMSGEQNINITTQTETSTMTTEVSSFGTTVNYQEKNAETQEVTFDVMAYTTAEGVGFANNLIGKNELVGLIIADDPDNNQVGGAVLMQNGENTVQLTAGENNTLLVNGQQVGGGITELVGTKENPINPATDMENGQLYSCFGYLRKQERTTWSLNDTYGTLIYKRGPTSIWIFGAYIENGLIYGDTSKGILQLDIYSDTGYWTGVNSASPYFISWLNGSRTGPNEIYVATNAGAVGQILQSNGENLAPTWIDMPKIPSIEGLATEEYVNIALGNLTSISFTPITELPTENISTTTIYLLPIEGSTNNIYEEYIYVNNNWEKIGTTSVDLNGYATTTQLEAVANISNTALQPEDAVTIDEIDKLFA